MISVWFDAAINAVWVSFRDDPFMACSLTARLDGETLTILRRSGGDALISARFDQIGSADGTSFADPGSCLAYLQAEFSRCSADMTGPPVVSAATLPAGTPVAVSRATGQIMAARADTKPLAFVTGLLGEDVQTGFAALALRGAVTMEDWTAVTGAPVLSVGQPYFLRPAGGLTLTPDRTPGLCITRVGFAAAPTTLIVQPTDPILL